jgi:hypothetical protein
MNFFSTNSGILEAELGILGRGNPLNLKSAQFICDIIQLPITIYNCIIFKDYQINLYPSFGNK